MLNDDENVSNYVTEYGQALNLGVYGADLGYVSIYEEKGSAMRYLTSIKKLTAELGLESAFDSDFISRFEANSQNQDSMVQLMSDAFSRADNFLKKSDRKSVSALVLAGGWIESLYFSCELNNQKESEKMLRRIGEQRQTLGTLIDLLSEYNKGQKNDMLINDLKGLMDSFDKIELNYEYEAPETNEKKRLTTLTHRLTVKVTDAVLNEIRTKITTIRNNIIKA
jgi:Mg2+ and Co2+ transporter CorA